MPGTTWQRWNWVEAAVLPLLGALTWATWAGIPIAALIDFVTNHQANPNAAPAVLLLLLGGTLAARLAGPSPKARWYVVLAGFGGVLVAEWWLLYDPAYALWDPHWLLTLAQQVGRLSLGPFLVAIIAAVAWRHGMTANWTSHDELAKAFVAGIVVLGFGLVMSAAFAPATASQLTTAAVQFLVAAWAALSLAGVADVSRTAATDDPPRLNRYWLLAVLTVVGAIFAAGLLLTSFLTPQTAAGWIAQLQPVVDLIRSVLLFVLYVVTYAVFWVLTPIIELIRRLLGPRNPQPFLPLSPFINPVTNQPETSVVLPPAVEFVLRALVIIGLLVAVGLVLAWALRRQSTTDQAGVRENRDLIWSWDLIRSQLAELLARQRRPPLFPGLTGDFDDPILWVRQAYRRVLAQALARGQARQPRQTPQSFLPTLDALWPDETGGLAELTEAYTAARYGQVPPSAGQLTALQQALDRLASAESPRPSVTRR
jgi:hypothetical protein